MSVFEVTGTSIVTALYDTFRSQLKSEYHYGGESYVEADALVVSFRADFSHHGFEADGNTPHKYGERHRDQHVHFILTGNVHVWAYVGPEWDPDRISLEEWRNTSNHDSCWRSDGVNDVLAKVYFQSCDYVQEHLPEGMRRRPIDVSKYITAGRVLANDLFGFVKIRFRSSASDDYGYDLIALEPSDKKLQLVAKKAK